MAAATCLAASAAASCCLAASVAASVGLALPALAGVAVRPGRRHGGNEVRAHGPGAGAGTIYVGNGAAPGRRRMAHITPIYVDSGRDAMIEFLQKIQQGSEYENVIEYLEDPEQGKKVPETMEKLRTILTNEFSGLDLSRKEIDDMLVEAAASIMGTSMMDDIMKPSRSLATIAAQDLRDDTRDPGVGKTILENLNVVLEAVLKLQDDPSSIGREPSAAQPVILSSTSGYRDTRREPPKRRVFKPPDEKKKREPEQAGKYSADFSSSESSDNDAYRLTLLRLRM